MARASIKRERDNGRERESERESARESARARARECARGRVRAREGTGSGAHRRLAQWGRCCKRLAPPPQIHVDPPSARRTSLDGHIGPFPAAAACSASASATPGSRRSRLRWGSSRPHRVPHARKRRGALHAFGILLDARCDVNLLDDLGIRSTVRSEVDDLGRIEGAPFGPARSCAGIDPEHSRTHSHSLRTCPMRNRRTRGRTTRPRRRTTMPSTPAQVRLPAPVRA